jgi:cbb3-type cytochrome oxidase subunit 1
LAFGGWTGIPQSAPAPAWLPSLSTVFTVFTVVALLAIALNLHQTLAGRYERAKGDPSLALAVFSAGVYVVAGGLFLLAALPAGNQATEFTLFRPGLDQLHLYGFYAIAVFAAGYYSLPRLLNGILPSSRLIRLHCWAMVAGVLTQALPLLLGGWLQGGRLNDPSVDFMQTLGPALMALRVSYLGDLLLLAGHVAFVANLCWGLWRTGREAYGPSVTSLFHPETTEVAR